MSDSIFFLPQLGVQIKKKNLWTVSIFFCVQLFGQKKSSTFCHIFFRKKNLIKFAFLYINPSFHKGFYLYGRNVFQVVDVPVDRQRVPKSTDPKP